MDHEPFSPEVWNKFVILRKENNHSKIISFIAKLPSNQQMALNELLVGHPQKII